MPSQKRTMSSSAAVSKAKKARAAADAALTHGSPLAAVASGTVALLCRHIIEGKSLQDSIAEVSNHPELSHRAAEPIRRCLIQKPLSVGPVDNGGFCASALSAALHFALSASDFSSGLSAAVKFARPDNYCPVICGALLGGIFGATAVSGGFFDTSRSHPSHEYATLKSEVVDLSLRLAQTWPIEKVQKLKVDSCTVYVDDLPSEAFCYVFSFLHSFLVAGPCAVVNQRFKSSTYNERLCGHLLDRDFAREEELPEAVQPARDSWRSRRPAHVPLIMLDLMPVEGHSDDVAKSLREVALRFYPKEGLQQRPYATIAWTAAQEGRPTLLSWAAEHGSLDDVDNLGRSALMIAATNNKPLTVAVAFGHCDANQTCRAFGTALHMAAYCGAAEAAGELCRCGADLEARNGAFGQTPLHVACSRNHAAVVQLLLASNADANARDSDGLTSNRIAQTMQSTAVPEILQRFAAGQTRSLLQTESNVPR